MGKSARDRILKFYEQADNDYDRALINLRKLAEIYAPGHSRQHAMIMAVVISTAQVQDVLKNIRSELA